MSLRGRTLLFALAAGLAVRALGAEPEPPRGRRVADADGQLELSLFVDRDDDDGDGVPDREQPRLPGRATGDVQWVEPKGGARVVEAVQGDAIRLVSGQEALDGVRARGRRFARFGVQGVAAGRARVMLPGLTVEARVFEVAAVDSNGEKVDLTRSHASISRTLPAGVGTDSDGDDRDALSWVVGGEPGSLPRFLGVSSFTPDDSPLDTLGDVELRPAECPSGFSPGLECRKTPPIRATSDLVDRSHPEAAEHSLVAEVGGRIMVGFDHAMAALRVGGPRHSRLGAIERYRGTLRVRLVRLSPKGSPPVGGTDAAALDIARDEVRTASSLWGQCGIHFGLSRELDVQVVDPPPPHLVAIGCDLGTPASGGEIAFAADKKPIVVPTPAHATPTRVASSVAAALRKAGFRASVSPNAQIAPGALRTVDVLVRRADGSLASLAPTPGRSVSSDPTLGACLGEVDLADGLSHFSDFDAVSGTVEERALVKAFDDGDPSTIEVLVVPSFARTGRIGESFIYADGSSMRNAVIIDRAAIRAGARSFALAHELGHILLDMPGHPDDYGVDRPSMLMDADAADPTIFGPRRLSVSECERALEQSGPDAPVPLLSAWPLTRSRSR